MESPQQSMASMSIDGPHRAHPLAIVVWMRALLDSVRGEAGGSCGTLGAPEAIRSNQDGRREQLARTQVRTGGRSSGMLCGNQKQSEAISVAPPRVAQLRQARRRPGVVRLRAATEARRGRVGPQLDLMEGRGRSVEGQREASGRPVGGRGRPWKAVEGRGRPWKAVKAVECRGRPWKAVEGSEPSSTCASPAGDTSSGVRGCARLQLSIAT